MRAIHRLGLAAVAGSAFVGLTLQAGRAQAPAPAYEVFENTITDQDGFMHDYYPRVRKSVEDAGGKALVRGGQTVAVEGAPPPQRVVIIQFESLAKAKAWVEASQDIMAIGKKYATIRAYLVEGLPQ
jgi:uncharacterized protein (DUF1330 family)